MPNKDKITDYSATAASNTDVGGINIDEGCDFGNMNNMGREIMSHLADLSNGTYPIKDTFSIADPSDLTKIARFDCGSITTSTTRVITLPDGDVTIPSGTIVTTTSTSTLTNKSFGDAVTISGTAAGALLTLATTDAGATNGPGIGFNRNSASPAANDVIGYNIFAGKDDGGNTNYAGVYGKILDPTDTSEDGALLLAAMAGGTFGTRVIVSGGLYTTNATDGDKGADTINASAIYDDGVQLQPEIGSGQTASTSFSAGTEYQNTTARTKEVYVTAVASAAGQYISLARGPTSGALTTLQEQESNGNSTSLAAMILVPPDDYWEVTSTAATSTTITVY